MTPEQIANDVIEFVKRKGHLTIQAAENLKRDYKIYYSDKHEKETSA